MTESTEGIWIIRNFWNKTKVAECFTQLQLELAPLLKNHTRPIVIYGFNVREPRSVFYQSKQPVADLTYAAVRYSTSNMVAVVESILNQLKLDFQPNSARFPARPNCHWRTLVNSLNCAVINVYEKDTDSMGAHSDNNKYIGSNKLIIIVSFGDSRQFVLRTNEKKSSGKAKGTIVAQKEIKAGDIIVMYGQSVQQQLKHEVPKKKNGTLRISVSFRFHFTK